MVREKKVKKKQFTDNIIVNIFPIIENYDDLIHQSYEWLKNGERMQIAKNIHLVRLLQYAKDYKPFISLDLRAIVPNKEYSYRNPLNIHDNAQFNVISELINTPHLIFIVKAVDKLNSEIKTYNELLTEKRKKVVQDSQNKN